MEEILIERWRLAEDRIQEIAKEPEVSGKPGHYFQKTAAFLLLMLETGRKAEIGRAHV